MKIDKFINALYKCEESKDIRDIENYLDIERPLINRRFKEDGDMAIVSQEKNVEVFFSDISKFNKNLDENQDCQIIFSGIQLAKDSSIHLPFNLSFDDNLETAIEKIGEKPNYTGKIFPKKIWHLKNKIGKDYLLYLSFDEDYTKILGATIQTYDNTIEYLS